MRYVVAVLICSLLFAPSAGADAKRQDPTYPFRLERSADMKSRIAGATGELIYRERSLGREAAFLSAPMPAGSWPIDVKDHEPLFPIAFAEGGVVSTYYCANKFKRVRDVKDVRDTPAETVCFQDGDNDGRFDMAAVGTRDSGFIIEITGHWIEATGDTIEGSLANRIGTPRAIAPTGYAIRQIRPAPGDEGVIELRYAGLRSGAPSFDASFRPIGAKAPLYSERVVAAKQRDARLWRLTLPHPVVAYRAKKRQPQSYGLTGPFPKTRNPVPAHAAELAGMIIDVTHADATRVEAIIVRPFGAWSWYRQNCDDDAPEIVHVDQGDLPALYSGQPVGLCEKTSWVQEDTWWIVGPENGDSGRLQREPPGAPKP